jgi:hypothetical protein
MPPTDDEMLLNSLRLPPGMAVSSDARSIAAQPPKQRVKPREKEPFVHCTVREFLAGVAALDGAREVAVWVYLLRAERLAPDAWQIPLSNEALAGWSVSRETKRRALQKLSEAELIRVKQAKGRSPRVAILRGRA